MLPSSGEAAESPDEIKNKLKEVLTIKELQKRKRRMLTAMTRGNYRIYCLRIESEGSFVIGFQRPNDFVLLCRKCCLSTVPFTPCLETW